MPESKDDYVKLFKILGVKILSNSDFTKTEGWCVSERYSSYKRNLKTTIIYLHTKLVRIIGKIYTLVIKRN